MRRHKPIRQINLRITEQLRRKLEAAAAERQISTNQLMGQLLEEGLEDKAESFAQRVARAVVKQLGAVAPPPGQSAPKSVGGGEALSQQPKKEEGDAS
jgi:hypothetical protein